MTRALIADDEPLLRAGLRAALSAAWPQLEIVAEACNGAEAVHLAREHRPDIAFLDIEMPLLNGLEAAKEMAPLAHIVFVTAYDRYAVEAFERGAVDYVLKPFNEERLAVTVGRLKERLAKQPTDMEALVETLAAKLAPRATEHLRWIKASVGSNVRLIPVEEILFFRSDEKYTRVVTAEGEALVKKTLRELVAELDPRHFWQVHRGTIVNIRAIAAVTFDDAGRREIALRGRPEKIEVSRTFAHLFKPS